MGTRGFWGVRDHGRTRTTYNHFDSYPTGLGTWIAKFVTETDLTTLGDRVFDLTLVEENDAPSEEQMNALVEAGTWASVSTGGDWYSALRGAQGNPQVLIDSGFWLSQGFDPLTSADSWLEWGYIIDLDEGRLTVYEMVSRQIPRAKAHIPFASLTGDYTRIMSIIEGQE
jgi:hypothetical protein